MKKSPVNNDFSFSVPEFLQSCFFIKLQVERTQNRRLREEFQTNPNFRIANFHDLELIFTPRERLQLDITKEIADQFIIDSRQYNSGNGFIKCMYFFYKICKKNQILDERTVESPSSTSDFEAPECISVAPSTIKPAAALSSKSEKPTSSESKTFSAIEPATNE